MESSDAKENIMEAEDNVGLSDIIDYLNTLDPNATPLTLEKQNTTNHSPPLTSKSNHQPGQQSSSTQSTSQSRTSSTKPYIKIVEQPAAKALRFRYECEGRSAGSIPGANSTAENKTYPTIEIVGYSGEVTVVVSCVTKDAPYRPHPHNLVGKDGCKNGICTLQLTGEPLRAVFSNLGIQCVKKRDIKAALDVRESMQVDPFRTKFGHKDQPSSIDLNVVRLCFQAFLKIGNSWKPLAAVVSDPIFDKKAMSDLVICRLCSCSAKVCGGNEIILLCEKVNKDDIKVKFYETNKEGDVIWEDYAEFQQTDIHKQTAIAFKTPRYHNTDIVDRAQVFLQLIRPSDGVTSESLPFEYHADPDQIKRKRLKTNGSPMTILRRELQKQEQQTHNSNTFFQNEFQDVSITSGNNMWNIPNIPEIKTEPVLSAQQFGAHRSPHHLSPSPQPQSPMMNRNSTPSPGLMKALSASTQAQMCDMFSYNIGMHSPMTNGSEYATSPKQAATFYNGIENGNNPFMVNGLNCDTSAVLMQQQNILSTSKTAIKDDTNPFTEQVKYSMSGGSITPLWSTTTTIDNNSNVQTTMVATASMMQHSMNIVSSPDMQMQQLQNDIDMLNNVTNSADQEEGPTLSGLLAFVDSEQLLNINSDELQPSNLSIRT